MSKSHNAPRDCPVVATDEPRLIKVIVKSSTGKQDFQVAEQSTVEQLKEDVSLRFTASKDQMLLIFAGKILKDQDTLLQHNIQDGVTVHLVVKKSELRNHPALQTHSVVPSCSSASASPASSSDIQTILASTRKDLVALLEILSELPQHFQACPELMYQVVQSPTIQSMISSNGSPLVVALVLGVSTLISLSTFGPSSGEEKVVSGEEITQALERATAHDILANTKEMAQFLSESPELKQYAEETPQFSRLMSPSGLTKMMVIYKKLPHLGSALAPGPDMSFVGDMLDDVHTFRQLFIDICKVLSSPEAQEELEERMLRHALATNSSLQQLAKENEEVRHMLNNPQVVGEIIKYIRSPEIRREMDRHCDRTLSNLESLPGGYSVLQHMYREFEEPIWDLLQEQHEGDLFATLGSNPSSGGAHPPPCIENRSPLPDPWAPRLDTTASKPGKSSGKHSAAEEEDVDHSPKCALEDSLVASHLGSQGGSSSETLPVAGMLNMSPLPKARADSSSQGADPPIQDHAEAQAADIRSEDQEEPHEVRTGPTPGVSSQALVETEDGQKTAKGTPLGSEPG